MEKLKITDLEKLKSKEIIELKNKLQNLDDEKKNKEILIINDIDKLHKDINNLNKKKHNLYNDYDKYRNDLIKNNHKVINDLWKLYYLDELNYLNDLFKNSKIGKGFKEVKILFEDFSYNGIKEFKVMGFELIFEKGVIKISLKFNKKEINKSFIEIIEIQNISLNRLIKNEYIEKKKFTDLHNFNEIENYINGILNYTENQIKTIYRTKLLYLKTQIKNKKELKNINENKEYIFYYNNLNEYDNKIFLIKKSFYDCYYYVVYTFNFFLMGVDNKFIFNIDFQYNLNHIKLSKDFKTFNGCKNNIIKNYNVNVEKIKGLKFKK